MAVLQRDPQVPASGIVEINFSLSCSPQACKAAFTFEKDNAERSFHFNSSTSEGADIISRIWTFGDGDSLTGNNKDPHHVYKTGGNYTACLRIKTAAGCESGLCQQITVAGHCKAAFEYNLLSAGSVRVNSSTSTGSTAGDNITERIWTWGDGSTLKGNLTDPTHIFAVPGSYNVCLRITTAQQCRDSICRTVAVPKPADPVSCLAKFKTAPTATISTLKFTIDDLQLQAHDSVAYFRWNFGDGTGQSGTATQVEHHYKLNGIYTVCLVLKTLRGCEYKFCAAVMAPAPVSCLSRFTWERLSPKKIRVNSGASFVQAGDSIVQRRWEFSDSTTLSGNDSNPAHEFKTYGTYTVCLHIKTAKGCESSFCTTVKVEDPASTAPGGDAVRIVELYPNPAVVQLNALLYSRYNNVKATLTVYDVYGNLKWTAIKTLSQGNNYAVIPAQMLTSGPYVLKVSTGYSVLSKNFFKL